jgi:hypothetical protein
MEQVTITISRTDLASRALAAQERENIVNYIDNGKTVLLNLEGVLSMSASYGDELFGILAKQLGIQTVTSNLKIVNVSDSVLESIAEAMYVRSTEHCQVAA